MPAPTQNAEDVALSLTLAVVTGSPGPLLLLDDHLVVIAASTSFGELFEASSADLTGRPLYTLGGGVWDSP